MFPPCCSGAFWRAKWYLKFLYTFLVTILIFFECWYLPCGSSLIFHYVLWCVLQSWVPVCNSTNLRYFWARGDSGWETSILLKRGNYSCIWKLTRLRQSVWKGGIYKTPHCKGPLWYRNALMFKITYKAWDLIASYDKPSVCISPLPH